MTEQEQQRAAKIFAEEWKNRGDEKSETHNFWIGLLHQVFGITNAENIIEFEKRVMLDHQSFIDGYIEKTLVLIEQKSIDIDLRKAYKQSDGSMLTPYQQAHRYSAHLKRSEAPRWIVVSNFKSFLVYDMENPNNEAQEILLENLEKEYYRLSFLAEEKNIHLEREMELSIKAGEIVGLMYDKLRAQYINPDANETLKSLNMLCVRLVFCMYAEDAGIFGHKSMFGDYIKSFETKDIRHALLDLFRILDLNDEKRKTDEDYQYADESLKAFPYVNGGLFTQEDKSIPQFTEEIKELLVNKASHDFDWSEISPTIFGAVFESTLNPETRRSGGMHYTSIENIHKVIDPLFMDSLNSEYEEIAAIGSEKKRIDATIQFQKKIGSLTFLDPACGSGNFLTETYLSLRRLENKCLRLRFKESVLDLFNDTIFVNIHQFYGIEINDFATVVAKTALWIAESQMMKETAIILDRNLDFLPLKSYANIVEGNALQIDWNSVGGSLAGNFVASPLATAGKPSSATPSAGSNAARNACYDYIMGNPPFVGYSLQTEEQKKDILNIYIDEKGKPYKTAGKIDFVAGWYFRASKLIQGTNTKCAFVSTNSITQGEQVAAVFKPLFERFNFNIDFAYRTFRWDSESSLKAHVHCVIVGFSDKNSEQKEKYIFDESGIKSQAKTINGYLIDAENVFVESRNKPLCNVIPMTTGNRPADGGHLIIEAADYDDFIKKEPNAVKYIKQLTGSEEYINNKKRYCLWLVDASPAELRKMPLVMQRVENCRQDRLNGADDRKKLAETPTLFREQNNYESYIIVPSVSSENRRYIPLGFLGKDTIPTNLVLIIPNATLYEFGILTSNVHMAWMRAVCGRLKSDYRYSKDIVYNNFPWCTPTDEQKSKIEATAQAILDARAQYPDCSLADLYDETIMPPKLRDAHQANDRAVMQAYGFSTKITESECVAELFKLYEEMTEGK